MPEFIKRADAFQSRSEVQQNTSNTFTGNTPPRPYEENNQPSRVESQASAATNPADKKPAAELKADLDKYEAYKVVDEKGDTGYDIARYYAHNPGSEKTLIADGFNASEVSKIKTNFDNVQKNSKEYLLSRNDEWDWVDKDGNVKHEHAIDYVTFTLMYEPDKQAQAALALGVTQQEIEHAWGNFKARHRPDEANKAYWEGVKAEMASKGLTMTGSPLPKSAAPADPGVKDKEDASAVETKLLQHHSQDETLKEVSNLDGIITGLEKKIDADYGNLIETDKNGNKVFTGTDAQYKGYQYLSKTLSSNIDKFNAAAGEADKKGAKEAEEAASRVTSAGAEDPEEIKRLEKIAADLKPYAVYGPEMWPAGTTEAEKNAAREKTVPPAYDIVSFLRDGGSAAALEKAGFTEASIKKAKDIAVQMPSKESFMDNYLQKNYGTSNTYEAVTTKISKQGDSSYGYLTKDQRMFKKALKAYTDKYGAGALIATNAADAGSVLVGPAARVLRPEVTVKELSGADVAWTVANIALLVAPFAVGKVITRIAGPGGKIAAALDREEIAMQKVLVRDNLDMLDPYRKLTAAQGKYAQKVVELKDAEKTLAAVHPGAEVYAGRAESVVKAREAAKAESNTLRAAGQDYVAAFKKSNKFPVDDTRLTETFDRLPGDLVKHTDDVVDDILKAKTKSGKTIEQTQMELARTRGNIAELEAKAKALPVKATQKDRLKIFRQITAEQKKAEVLTRDIKKGFDNLNIESMVKTEEWKELRIRKELESRFGGGGTQTIVKPKTPGKYGTKLDTEMSRAGYGTKSAVALGGSAAARGSEKSLRATTPEQAAKEESSRSGNKPLNDAVSTQTLSSPSKSPAKAPGSKSRNKPAEWSKPGSASSPNTGSETKTSTKTKTETNVKPETNTQPASQKLLANAPRPATSTKTKTMVRTPTPAKLNVPIKPFAIKKKGSEGNGKKGALEVKKGSLVWEQGKLEVDAKKPGPETVYKYAEPNKYEVKTSVDKAPKGYQDTGDTPKETIQAIGGPVKKDVSINMGITTAHARANTRTIHFTTNRINKPAELPGKAGTTRLTKGSQPITKRNKNITSRGVSITPKRPRISR